MPEIAFHFNAPDKLAYACRFARKALRHGAKLAIIGPQPALQTLDAMLWSMAPQDFVAHAMQGGDALVWSQSPVVLAEQARDLPHEDVLLNLGRDLPEGFERFQRVVEIVSAVDAHDRAQARVRWRQYQSQGFEIVRHDLVLKGA
jgi:DNA polymerase-3 subunit chi